MRTQRPALLTVLSLASAALLLTVATPIAFSVAQAADAGELRGFLPKPPAGWTSDAEDWADMPPLPGGQVMANYESENGDVDAIITIGKQMKGADAAIGKGGPAAAGPEPKISKVDVDGFPGTLTEDEEIKILAVPAGSHVVAITSGTATQAQLLTFARSIKLAKLAKR